MLRSSIKRNNFNFILVEDFNLPQLKWNKYDYLLKYTRQNSEFFLRHYSIDDPKSKDLNLSYKQFK